ncbi:MAG TPA: hypothetical protein VFS12_11300 [Terriglobia bacterium]|nr:hypothetical protein [Terriglobia bacterium]
MSTGLIAELADIDLKDGDPSGAKGEQANSAQLRLEGRATCHSSEQFQLLHCGSKTVMLSKKRQSHTILSRNGENDLKLSYRISLCG